jgi:F-box/WD-40 domain protein MET30
MLESKKRKLNSGAVVIKKRWKEIYAERFLVERNWRKGLFRVEDFISHTNRVLCFLVDERMGKMVSCSADGTVRVWDIDSGKCIKILQGHNSRVTGLHFDESKIVSCSHDGTIRIWNALTFECIKVH